MAGTFHTSYGVNVWTSDKQCTIIDAIKSKHANKLCDAIQIKPGHPDDGTQYNVIDLVTTSLTTDGFKSMTVSLTKHAALALSLELRKLAIGV